ncbi:MAG: hypothetical protein Q8Q33_07980, partial [Chlamydiota bacterium]|nr:hypothetical protein [Chlamydiota bacterium]
YASVVMIGGFVFLFALMMFQGKSLQKSVEVKYITGHPSFLQKIIGELIIENKYIIFKRLYLNEIYFQIPISRINRITISSMYTQRRVTLFVEYRDKDEARVLEFSTPRNKILLKIKEEIDNRVERYERIQKNIEDNNKPDHND